MELLINAIKAINCSGGVERRDIWSTSVPRIYHHQWPGTGQRRIYRDLKVCSLHSLTYRGPSSGAGQALRAVRQWGSVKVTADGPVSSVLVTCPHTHMLSLSTDHLSHISTRACNCTQLSPLTDLNMLAVLASGAVLISRNHMPCQDHAKKRMHILKYLTSFSKSLKIS